MLFFSVSIQVGVGEVHTHIQAPTMHVQTHACAHTHTHTHTPACILMVPTKAKVQQLFSEASEQTATKVPVYLGNIFATGESSSSLVGRFSVV